MNWMIAAMPLMAGIAILTAFLSPMVYAQFNSRPNYCSVFVTDDIPVGSVWSVRSPDPFSEYEQIYTITEERFNPKGERYLRYDYYKTVNGVKSTDVYHMSAKAKHFLCFGSWNVVTRKK